MNGEVYARRLVLCLWVALLVTAAIAFRERGSDEQTFAAFGQAKRITLPLIYLLFFAAAVLPAPARLRRQGPRPPLPLWAWFPAAAIVISFVIEAVIASASLPLDIVDVLQGLALFLGFALLGGFGSQADSWSAAHRSHLLTALFVAALGAGLMGANGMTPFVALGAPGCFAALLLACRLPDKRLRYAGLGLALGALTVRSLEQTSQQPPSFAVLGQIAACGALLLLLTVPRAFRPAVILLALAAAAWYFVHVNGPALLQGRYYSIDVTIAQRSYEARMVNSTVGEHLWSILFGLGPGATLDLSTSPDASTLASSGRNLAAVDDVHLLSAYLTLKLGIVGLVWAVLLFVAIWRVTVRHLRTPGPDAAWGLALLMFVVAGMVNALPAATNLLANPLVPLLLGVLWANAPSQDPQENGAAGEEKGRTRPSPHTTDGHAAAALRSRR